MGQKGKSHYLITLLHFDDDDECTQQFKCAQAKVTGHECEIHLIIHNEKRDEHKMTKQFKSNGQEKSGTR